MNHMMKIIAGGFFLSAAITAHAGANLIKNGTFEAPNARKTVISKQAYPRDTSLLKTETV